VIQQILRKEECKVQITVSLRLTDAEFVLLDHLLMLGVGRSQSDILRQGLVSLAEPHRIDWELMNRIGKQREQHKPKTRKRKNRFA
jgi:hypothetical protein